jgi:hypothetical protein
MFVMLWVWREKREGVGNYGIRVRGLVRCHNSLFGVVLLIMK